MAFHQTIMDRFLYGEPKLKPPCLRQYFNIRCAISTWQNLSEPLVFLRKRVMLLLNGREIFQKEREDKAFRSSGNGTIEAIRQLRAEDLEAEESFAAFVATVRCGRDRSKGLQLSTRTVVAHGCDPEPNRIFENGKRGRDPARELALSLYVSTRAWSKYRCEANHTAPRWSNRVPGKQPAEVDNIENVVEVLPVRLKPHIDPLRLVEVGPG